MKNILEAIITLYEGHIRNVRAKCECGNALSEWFVKPKLFKGDMMWCYGYGGCGKVSNYQSHMQYKLEHDGIYRKLNDAYNKLQTISEEK